MSDGTARTITPPIAETGVEEERRRQVEAEEELRYHVRRRLDGEHGIPAIASAPPAAPPPAPSRSGLGKKLMEFLNSSVACGCVRRSC